MQEVPAPTILSKMYNIAAIPDPKEDNLQMDQSPHYTQANVGESSMVLSTYPR